MRVDSIEPAPRTLVLAEIQELDVEQGRNRRLGVSIGGAVGLVVGGAIGYFVGSNREQPGTQPILPPTLEPTMAAMDIGGISGMVLGWLLAPPHWVEVPLPGKSR